MMNLIYALEPGAYAPVRAHEADAGWDLKVPDFGDTISFEGKSVIIDTGVHVKIPFGYVGLLKSRSSLNINEGITSEGVIDSGYTGTIKVKLYSHEGVKELFGPGDRITQLVIVPLLQFTGSQRMDLEEFNIKYKSDRGTGGLGSTGR